jgi:hypothetical protein
LKNPSRNHLSANIFPTKPIKYISNDSRQQYPVTYRAFTFTPSIGVNIAYLIEVISDPATTQRLGGFSHKPPNKEEGTMKRMLVAVLLVLAFLIASAKSPQAAPKGSNLHGEYSMVGTRTCVQVNGGADFVLPNYSLPPGGGSTRTTH